MSIISALLFIPSGSAAAVRKVLTDCQTARLALDSHGFADLDAAVAFQCALASADTSAAGAALRAKWNIGERGRAWFWCASSPIDCCKLDLMGHRWPKVMII